MKHVVSHSFEYPGALFVVTDSGTVVIGADGIDLFVEDHPWSEGFSPDKSAALPFAGSPVVAAREEHTGGNCYADLLSLEGGQGLSFTDDAVYVWLSARDMLAAFNGADYEPVLTICWPAGDADEGGRA